MSELAYFDFEERQREKQESRDHDLRLIASGEAALELVSRRNGLFSALNPSRARIVQRRAEIRIS